MKLFFLEINLFKEQIEVKLCAGRKKRNKKGPKKERGV